MFWGGFFLDRTPVVCMHHVNGKQAPRWESYTMETNSGTGASVRPLGREVHFGSLTVSDTLLDCLDAVLDSFDLQRSHPREVVVWNATMPSFKTAPLILFLTGKCQVARIVGYYPKPPPSRVGLRTCRPREEFPPEGVPSGK